MSSMSTVVSITAGRDRRRRIDKAVDARRGLDRRERARRGGRLWLNGRELGGARDALAHLSECYD